MAKAIMYTVRTMFYSSLFVLAVIVPQAIAQALGAPIVY